MIKKYGIYVLVISLLIGASWMIYDKLNPKKLPANLISATGKMDGDLITLNTKYAGRIKSINIQDGQSIKQLQTIAILSSREYENKLQALSATVEAAKNGLKAMQDELAILRTVIPLGVTKAQKAVAIAKDQAQQLQNSIKSIEAITRQSKKDLQRTQTLFGKNLIAKHKLELAQLQYTTNTHKLHALQEQLNAAQKAVSIANDTYKIALSQNKKITALQAKIAAAKNKIQALQANKAELQSVIDELTIRSPIDGFIIEKIANKGEVLAAGMAVATLIQPESLYLKVFIDTLQNGKVKIGDKAVIFLDAYPNKAIQAKVVSIAANAEFTPKEVAVKSDRIQKVFAVHLKPLHVNPLLKLGIPAIGVISINAQGLPSSLDEIPSI